MEINIMAPKGFRLTGEFRQAEAGEWRWNGNKEPFLQDTVRSVSNYFILKPVVPKRIVLEQCYFEEAVNNGDLRLGVLGSEFGFWQRQNPKADYEWYRVVPDPNV